MPTEQMPTQEFLQFCAEVWIPKLEDPAQQQAETVLRRNTTPPSHCCLGLACDLVDPEGWSRTTDPDSYAAFHYKGQDSGMTLPLTLARDWGVHSTITLLINDGLGAVVDLPAHSGHIYTRNIDMAGLNDHARLTFRQIATVLRIAIDPDDDRVTFR